MICNLVRSAYVTVQHTHVTRKLEEGFTDLQRALVENSIKYQTVEIIDERCVKTLIDRTKHTIQRVIPEILEFLSDRYCQIEDEDLQDIEEEIKELKYELINPIVNIFNEIEDLRDLGVTADNKYSEQQLVKFGLQIIKNNGELEYDIRISHGLAKTARTWDDFKMHFEAAHRILKITRGKTMQSSSFHQANMLVE